MASHFLQRVHQAVAGQAALAQDFRGGARLVEKREQDVLDRNVIVLELARLLLGASEDPAQPLGDIDLAGVGAAAAHTRDFVQLSLELAGNRRAIDAREFQNRGGQALLVFKQRV